MIIMKMIVGLGNIGPQYDGTRHNTGFMVVEEFAKKYGISIKTRKMNAKMGSAFVNGQKVLVVEPTTFMNDSGIAVKPLMSYFEIENKDVIVVHDDMDLPIGKIRIKDKGSAGGHNGIKSLINNLGTEHFSRIRVGIAHPDKNNTVVNYVLGRFSKSQLPEFKIATDNAVNALEDWLDDVTIPELENRYN
ncbi:aminoacyl-tRNA hydrolase [Lentilactobacillus hilgardii]|uniref:Peptidyl-tRNA hydrolase n=2 Tax=Lentilactobacillus hilgardii TaxID=1588 RepID=C0XFV0_LENH9|nr:aminoacyl-tRNA hydrolase [Lentilactobacillus hilgardii DSM 20176 = ATCC 8290]QEU38977.1 aminoacyl-tRNA hydrolase [Lentilactobacillus hilgardii]